MKETAVVHSVTPAPPSNIKNVTSSKRPLCKRHEKVLDGVLSNACRSTGAKSTEFADHILVQVAYGLVWPRPKDNHREQLVKAEAAISEMSPQNATEAMLAVQMIACHDAALNFLCRATAPDQSIDVIDRNVLRATRLMRIFGEQLEAMQRLRGTSCQQKVTVEHVHVNQGGQAIVGGMTLVPVPEEPGENDRN